MAATHVLAWALVWFVSAVRRLKANEDKWYLWDDALVAAVVTAALVYLWEH